MSYEEMSLWGCAKASIHGTLVYIPGVRKTEDLLYFSASSHFQPFLASLDATVGPTELQQSLF